MKLHTTPILVVFAAAVGLSVATETAAQTTAELPAASPENSVAACQDGTDNDGDSHVDCADQDCQIFAVCVQMPSDETANAPTEDLETEASVETSTASVTIFHSGPRPEHKRQCSDGLDNNNNGLIDCQEASCQRSFYCRREMYEYPNEGNSQPGLFINFGFGAALPNYRTPRATTDSVYGEIPFELDLGGMMDLQTGFLFFKWFGAGINFKSAVTYASNEFSHAQGGDEDFKYWGYKTWFNVGGFLRFQWPFKRLVPYLNVHAGYSTARNRWNVYDDANSWDDIWDHESDSFWPIDGIRDERYSGPKRHFTFSLEPGLDIFVVDKLFAVGVKAWLPVVASSDAERDNVGVLLGFTFTPGRRGKAQLKEKYKNLPAATASVAAAPIEAPAAEATQAAVPDAADTQTADPGEPTREESTEEPVEIPDEESLASPAGA